MNRKINKIMTWLAAAIFLLALTINVKVTLDDPFMMLSEEAIAITSSSDSSGGDVTWFAKLTAEPVHGKVAHFEGGCTIPFTEVNLPVFCNYTVSDGVVGYTKNCTFWLASQCDQNKVGYFPVTAGCGPCQ